MFFKCTLLIFIFSIYCSQKSFKQKDKQLNKSNTKLKNLNSQNNFDLNKNNSEFSNSDLDKINLSVKPDFDLDSDSDEQ